MQQNDRLENPQTEKNLDAKFKPSKIVRFQNDIGAIIGDCAKQNVKNQFASKTFEELHLQVNRISFFQLPTICLIFLFAFRNPDLVCGLYACGISNLTKSQCEVLPSLIASPPLSAVVKSEMGSGKTLMIAAAAINRIDVSQNCPQVLCICCTFESALQTGITFARLGVYRNVKVGYALQRDGKVVNFEKDCHVIVGTPKEMASLRILGYFDLKRIIVAIFDDADVITTTALLKQHILRQLPANCQKIHVSATSNRSSLLYFTQNDVLQFVRSNEIPALIRHFTINCANKFKWLLSIVQSVFKNRQKVIVFCSVSIYIRSNLLQVNKLHKTVTIAWYQYLQFIFNSMKFIFSSRNSPFFHRNERML